MREGLRRSGGVFGEGLSWLSRASFCEGIGRSVTDDTVWEMEGVGLSRRLAGESIVLGLQWWL